MDPLTSRSYTQALEENNLGRVNTRPWNILVPIALFASLSRRGLGTKIDEPFFSCAKVPPAKRSEKGDGDENGLGRLERLGISCKY